MAQERKQVELVVERDRPYRTAQIGLGLLASLIVGYGPLTDALFGHGSFENAMGRFLACVAFCVVAAAVVGRLLDAAPTRTATAAQDSAAEPSEVPALPSGHD